MRVAPKLRAVVMHSTMFNSGEAGNWFFEVSRADVGTQFGWLVRACAVPCGWAWAHRWSPALPIVAAMDRMWWTGWSTVAILPVVDSIFLAARFRPVTPRGD
jgi:hypothetical protein